MKRENNTKDVIYINAILNEYLEIVDVIKRGNGVNPQKETIEVEDE